MRNMTLTDLHYSLAKVAQEAENTIKRCQSLNRSNERIDAFERGLEARRMIGTLANIVAFIDGQEG